ncbi:hypothetical protein SAMN04487970_102750 [Paenibacillus tianmuensis]|uniref:Uncharacterized protein n=1 Tax=Paenibacillus tianmuensis TaxID=624147 RepID=A0A1G4SES9_9BACL|nr:hypothetical protein [Paenibacillus tianmuensis]SCW67683.1 hypothetical protein SAMN04487970_102750 [Paenibacillus tianmuensis]
MRLFVEDLRRVVVRSVETSKAAVVTAGEGELTDPTCPSQLEA